MMPMQNQSNESNMPTFCPSHLASHSWSYSTSVTLPQVPEIECLRKEFLSRLNGIVDRYSGFPQLFPPPELPPLLLLPPPLLVNTPSERDEPRAAAWLPVDSGVGGGNMAPPPHPPTTATAAALIEAVIAVWMLAVDEQQDDESELPELPPLANEVSQEGWKGCCCWCPCCWWWWVCGWWYRGYLLSEDDGDGGNIRAVDEGSPALGGFWFFLGGVLFGCFEFWFRKKETEKDRDIWWSKDFFWFKKIFLERGKKI